MPLIPTYAPTDWVDNTTPVDEAHMDKMETGIKNATDGVNALDVRVAAEEAQPDIPAVVNGKWIKGVGGAMVWSDITQADVSGLTTSLAGKISAPASPAANDNLLYDGSAWANQRQSVIAGVSCAGASTDLGWVGGRASQVVYSVSPVGGSIRSIAAPTYGEGTRLLIRNGAGSGTLTLLHATAGGTGTMLHIMSGTNVLATGEAAEFHYITGYWVLHSIYKISGARRERIPIRLRVPRSSTLAGNSSFSVTAQTAYDAAMWEFVNNVDGYVYGHVTLPAVLAATPNAEIHLVVASAAGSGSVYWNAAWMHVADAETLNPAAFTFGAGALASAGAWLRRSVSFPVTGTLAARGTLLALVLRNGVSASDTAEGTAYLLDAYLEVDAA